MTTARRIQGQQGDTSVALTRQIVEIDGDYTLDGRDDLIIATAACVATLPPSPYPGEEHQVSADGGTCTVKGGTFPIVGGDVAVESGSIFLFIFSSKGHWLRGSAALNLAGNVVGPANNNVVAEIDGVAGAVGPNQGANWGWASRPATATPGTFVKFDAGPTTAPGTAGNTATGWRFFASDAPLDGGFALGGGRVYFHLGQGSDGLGNVRWYNAGRLGLFLGPDTSNPVIQTFPWGFAPPGPMPWGFYLGAKDSGLVFGDEADPAAGTAALFLPPNQLAAQANSLQGPGNALLPLLGSFSNEDSSILEVWIGKDPGAFIGDVITASWSKANLRTSGRYTFGDTALLAVNNPSIDYGAGDPNGAITAGKSSLFLRTDGAAGSHVYVNQDGGTTWLPIAGI